MDRLQHACVRVYGTLRTAHLERFHELEPASVVYVARRYDFDPALLVGLDVHRVPGSWRLFRLLLAADVRVVEVNEPLMLAGLRTGLVTVLAVRLRDLLRRRRTRVVAYAIENLDPFRSGQRRVRTRWRRAALRLLARLLAGQVDRLAVGTAGAAALYTRYAPRSVRLVPALPAACATCPPPRDEERDGVLFVGAFDERKGLRQLLDAWPEVRRAVPGATLRLLGKGPLAELAEHAAATTPGLLTVLDPARRAIHEAMRSAKVLVLLSQPSSTWREQVGLPIVEGLSHGCEIVTTDQTGLAGWLAGHGHRVVAPEASAEAVAGAVVAALSARRTAADVVGSLPAVDGRLAADRWMFATTSGHDA